MGPQIQIGKWPEKKQYHYIIKYWGNILDFLCHKAWHENRKLYYRCCRRGKVWFKIAEDAGAFKLATKLQFVPIQKIRISEIWYFWIRISLLVRRVQQWHHLPTSQCSVPSVQPQRRELMLLPCQIPNIIDRSTDIPHIQNHGHINDLERVVMHQMCHY